MRTTRLIGPKLRLRYCIDPEPVTATSVTALTFATIHVIFNDERYQYAYEMRNRTATVEALVGVEHEGSTLTPLVSREGYFNPALLALAGYSMELTVPGPGEGRTVLRSAPLRCPFDPTLCCVRADLVDTGYNTVTSYLPPHADELVQWSRMVCPEWAIFRLSFSALPYTLGEPPYADTVTGPTSLTHYIAVRRQSTSRERRISGFGLEYEQRPNVFATVPDESTFVPETTVRFSVTCYQIPEAVAIGKLWEQVAKLAGTVNEETMTIGGSVCEPETLLYRGISEEVQRYIGADGRWYYDLTHVFDYRPKGHNVYPVGTVQSNGEIFYGVMRRKWPSRPAGHPKEDPPMHARENHRLLFPVDYVISPIAI